MNYFRVTTDSVMFLAFRMTNHQLKIRRRSVILT